MEMGKVFKTNEGKNDVIKFMINSFKNWRYHMKSFMWIRDMERRLL